MVNANVIDLEQMFEDCKAKVRNMDDIITRKNTEISRLKKENAEYKEVNYQLRERYERVKK